MASVKTTEAETVDNSGYFYKRLGELRFSGASDAGDIEDRRRSRPLQRLAVASKHGIAIFSDHTGALISKRVKA